MTILAFGVIAFTLTMYIVLDGYDLGVGALAPFIARTSEQRRALTESIGPFWNGNEVWLVAAGGALFALFPLAYAASFSAFYLPFMLILWLLMFRGIALELRGHLEHPLWHRFWDTAFSAGSALLAFLYGVTMGNLVRGLPLDRHGYFLGTFAFLLNPYALAVGAFALATLMLHGATFLCVRLEGPLARRSRSIIGVLWAISLVLYLTVSISTITQRWNLAGHGISGWLIAVPLLSVAAFAAVRVLAARGEGSLAFASSTAFIASLAITAACTMYPYILPEYPFGSGGLRVIDAVSSPSALAGILVIAIVGLCAVCAYSAWVVLRLRGKVATHD